MSVLEILLYIAAGIILDFLLTLQQRAVVTQSRGAASWLTLAVTLLAVLAIQKIVKSDGVFETLAYAGGCAFGTFIGMTIGRHTRKKEKKNGS